MSKLENDFYTGMLPEDVAEVAELVGKIWVVESYHAESQTYELAFRPKRSGAAQWHFIWVSPSWFEGLE